MRLSDHPILKRLVSAVLLLLFALSITPRKTLHDWLVNHKDGGIAVHDGKAVVAPAGFYCDTQSLVAESAFVADHVFPAIDFVPEYSRAVTDHLYFLHRITFFFTSFRGPPSGC